MRGWGVGQTGGGGELPGSPLKRHTTCKASSTRGIQHAACMLHETCNMQQESRTQLNVGPARWCEGTHGTNGTPTHGTMGTPTTRDTVHPARRGGAGLESTPAIMATPTPAEPREWLRLTAVVTAGIADGQNCPVPPRTQRPNVYSPRETCVADSMQFVKFAHRYDC